MSEDFNIVFKFATVLYTCSVHVSLSFMIFLKLIC